MNQNIPRGQLSTILLSTLLSGDKYGYEIINDVKEKTNGELLIKQPSLYSSLSRMEKQGFISSYWRDSDIGGKRHYYSLTDLGKKQLEKLEDNFYVSHKNVSNCLSPSANPATQLGQASIQNQNNLKQTVQDNNSENFIDNDLENNFKENKNSMETKILHQNSFLSQKVSNDELNEDNSQNPYLIPLKNQLDLFAENQQNGTIEQEKNDVNIQKEYENLSTNKKSFSIEVKTAKRKPFEDANLLIDDSELKNINNYDIDKNEIEFQRIAPLPEDENFVINEEPIAKIQSVDILKENMPQNIDKDEIEKDGGIFIQTPTPNQQKKALELEKELEEADKKSKESLNFVDNGIFITDKYAPEDMPKVKKIDIVDRLEDPHFANIKLSPRKMDIGYTEKINELYNKSNEVNEKEFVEDFNVESYNQLEEYYKNLDVKFSTYPSVITNDNKPLENRINHHKTAFKKFSILFLIAFVETLICYFAFQNFNLAIDYSFVYFLLPALFLIAPIYHFYMDKNKKEKWISEIKLTPLWVDIMIFFIGIALLYSFNMLIGMTYINIANYASTFIYPAIILTNIIVNILLNLKLYKDIKIKYSNV